MTNFPILLCCDAYKLSHRGFMVPGTQEIYSNLTPRSGKLMTTPLEGILWFGMRGTLQELHSAFQEFFRAPKEYAVRTLKDVFDAFLGDGAIDMHHFEELHDLGYLPVRIKSLREGTFVPFKVAVFTIRNTHKKFAWLTNFLETWLSAETWKATTVASNTFAFRKLVNAFAMDTVGSLAGTEFQIHDFSYRGMSNTTDAAKCGLGFLLSTRGTDTVPALWYAKTQYGANLRTDFVGTSVPASEHSLASAGIAVDGELETFRRWVTKDYPTGIVSVIADTLDFFKVVTEYATELKDDILNRQPNALGLAKVVFRPDSGDPVKIVTGYKEDEVRMEARFVGSKRIDVPVCVETGRELSDAELKGAVQCLYDVFGGTKTEQGFIQLHERVGLIYGDSITYTRAKEIMQRLKDNGFASTNIVFGVGSYSNQYMTRDTAGFAVKATSAVIDGERYELSKDPATDSGTKKSAKGLLKVYRNEEGTLVMKDQCTEAEELEGLLEVVYEDGIFRNIDDFVTIRQRVESQF